MINGSEPRATLLSEILSVISNHAELLALEWRYESRQTLRRLMAVGTAVVMGMTAFFLVQVALLYGLRTAGLNLGWAAVVLAGVYLIIAGIIWKIFGKRDGRAGPPFQGTRRQMPESMEWIQKLFS